MAPEPSDSTPVTLTIDGQQVTKPFAEWKSLTMQSAAATKRFQEAATIRKEVEARAAELAQREQTVKAFLQDPSQVREYLQMLEARMSASVPGASAGQSPDQPITARQMAEIVQAIRQEQDQKQQGLFSQLQRFATVQTIETVANQTLSGLFSQHPELKAIPKADVLIRQIAADGQYDSVEAMAEGLKAAARSVLAVIGARTQEQAAQAQERLANLVKTGIEPPGGTGILPQTTSTFDPKTRRQDWSAVNTEAKAWIEGRLRAQG
jgi:hypothetical protein